MSRRPMTRARIVEALTALGDDLKSQQIRGQVFVVGGAAMALAYSTRRVTTGIDAVFEPKALVYRAAARVAEALDLPEDWLNDGVKAIVPGNDPDQVPVPEIEGIEVAVASPRFLLAMKLMAMRFGEDEEDIEVLLDLAGIRRTDEALELLARVYPTRKPPLKTRLFLDELLGPDEVPDA